MGTLTDILQVSDRILDFLKRRRKSDTVVFEKLIDPLYVQLDSVVKDLIEMYQPIATSLIEFNQQRMAPYNAKYDSLWQTRSELTIDEMQAEQEDLERLYEELFLQHEDEFMEILASFKHQRANSRPARLKADAAAWALYRHYEDRSDEFADRVREFAWKIRTIVGRAHNEPLGIFLGKDRVDMGMEFSTGVLELALESIPRYMKRSFQVQEYERLTNTYEEVIDSEIATVADQKTIPDLLRVLSFAIRSICQNINKEWDDVSYIYAMLRLSVVSRNNTRAS